MASQTRSDALYDDFEAQAVLAHLGRGKDAAKPMEAIAEELGGSWSYRAVKRAVQRLRVAGSPVAADSRGVWFSDEPADMEATYRHIRSQIEAQSRTAWACRSTARRMRAAQVEQLTWTGEAA